MLINAIVTISIIAINRSQFEIHLRSKCVLSHGLIKPLHPVKSAQASDRTAIFNPGTKEGR